MMFFFTVVSFLLSTAAGQGSPGDKCAMCEYLVEMADRIIKAKGRMVPGGGYTSGVMAFAGGNVKGNLKVQIGAKLFLEEKSRLRNGRGRLRTHPIEHRLGGETRTPSQTRTMLVETSSNAVIRKTSSPLETMLSHQYDALDAMDETVMRGDTKASVGGLDEKLSGNMMRFVSGTNGEGVWLGGGAAVPPRTNRLPPLMGKLSTHMRKVVQTAGARGNEFNVVYTSFMDALENECGRMPKAWQGTCAPLFKESDKLVEMYIHGYDTWRMCSNIPTEKSSPCSSIEMFENV